MSRILMISHVDIEPKGQLFGPSIRIWETAKALRKKGHIITIAEKENKKEESIEEIRFTNYNLSLFKDLKKNYDIVFVQIWFNEREILEKIGEIPIIVDVSAPYLLEHICYDYQFEDSDSFSRFVDDIWLSTLIPLKYGDYFICANERQRRYYLGMLSALGRVNPWNKHEELIGIVPYGISSEKFNPLSGKKILREKVPEGKKIILWLSTFFPWLDPLKTAEIFKELLKLRKDYVLAVVGAKNPHVNASLYSKNYNRFYSYVKDHNMLNKNVFMFDWLDYKDISIIYNECDLFITTYKSDILETEFSYRGRIIDALWGRLPVICDSGDVVSDIINEKQLGFVIGNKTPKEIAKIIAKIKPKDIKGIKANIDKFILGQTWDKLVEPIDSFCKKPFIDTSKHKFFQKSFFDSRRDLILELRKEIEQKDTNISGMDFHYKNEMELWRELLNERDTEINHLKLVAQNQQATIDKLRRDLGKFKASLTYPIYKLTSGIGETKIGKVLQKIVK